MTNRTRKTKPEAQSARKRTFSPGRFYITPGACTLNPRTVNAALARHLAGDWGLVGPEDWRSNDRALKRGSGRLFSVYDDGDTRFWIITEADRSMTTVLLPLEY